MKTDLGLIAVCIGILMIATGLAVLFGWPVMLLFAGVCLVAWGGATR